MKRSVWLRLQLLVLVMLLVLLGVLGANRQAIQDWLRLHNYAPPTLVAQLATDDTMTPWARHLFYVNHPTITTGTSFTSHCPAGGEKTVVLGCYIGSDQGIYLYAVADSRLQGVEEVTAAHETLHAAYRRLSIGERNKVNAMLTQFYTHGLTDQRVKDTIAAYKQSEPNDVVNEMHSVFGTEIPNLPAPLEQYYRQYFNDRSKITAYTASYQAEFTSRQALISHYDLQLQALKQQISTNESTLAQQKTALDAQNQQLRSERSNGSVGSYNADVASYDVSVNNYNSLLATTKNLINQYNDLVSKRNAVVLEEQQLTQDLSANSATPQGGMR